MLDRPMRHPFTPWEACLRFAAPAPLSGSPVNLASVAGHYKLRSFKCPLYNHMLHPSLTKANAFPFMAFLLS